MTDRERLIEAYEDALLALLMDEVAQSEGEKALQLNKQLQADPDAAVPDAVQRRCMKTIRTTFAIQGCRRAGRVTGKIIQRISVVAMFGVLMFITVFATSQQFRVKTFNTLIDVFDDYSQITFQNIDENSIQSDTLTYHHNIALEWIPEKYEVIDGWSDRTGDFVCYADKDGHEIKIDVTPIKPTLTYQFDTEDAQKSEVQVQGYSADLYSKEVDHIPGIAPYMERSVIWIDENEQIIVHILSTDLSESEILKLAEGLKWIR